MSSAKKFSAQVSERSHYFNRTPPLRRVMAFLLVLVLTLPFAPSPWAETHEVPKRQAPEPESASGLEGLKTLPIPTLGGKQLWADHFIYAGWRIQRNVITGHFRLLDPQDIRWAWGSYSDCRKAFDAKKAALNFKPASDHLVLLLHGLGRSKDSFGDMEEALKWAGYEVMAINYPSTRQSVAAHAEDLGTVLDRLEDTKRVSFVTHSLGSFVLRELLSQRTSFASNVVLERAVLIGPPSQGADLADRLKDFAPVQWFAGPSVQDLTTGEAESLPGLPIPFGVVAGGLGDGAGYNPVLEGDDDGVVRVSEARLAGAVFFKVVPEFHTFLANHRDAIAVTLQFLKASSAADPRVNAIAA